MGATGAIAPGGIGSGIAGSGTGLRTGWTRDRALAGILSGAKGILGQILTFLVSAL